MEPQTLSAEVRSESGKGPARQLRAQGKIPAIFYGPATDPVKLTVSPADLERALSGKHRRNQTIELKFGDESRLALVKDLEVNPVTRELLHADFYAVSTDRKVKTTVPFDTVGRAIGVQKGGKIRKLFRELPIEAFPQDVPDGIIHDIAALDAGIFVRVEDLKLPAGVEVSYPGNRRLLIIELKEAKETDEAAAAAPAAGKKK